MITVLQRAQKLQSWLTERFRQLHQVPELDRALPKTTSLITQWLDEESIEWHCCADGIVAELKGSGSRPAVALRADMDALPITEETGLPWASKHVGQMHACGHDAHVTCALGALKLLKEMTLPGPFKVLFQPAEETDGGAKPMIKAGALKDPDVAAALCLHVAPSLTTGTVMFSGGKTCAASNGFDIVLKGRGSHGASPHLGIDVVTISSQIVSALQQIVSRSTAPTDGAVVTIGSFHAGTARNVIPSEARLEGILRTLTPQTRQDHQKRIETLVCTMAQSMGAQAEVTFFESYPALINDETLANHVTLLARQLLGHESVLPLDATSMGVDDFAYICEEVPGCYVQLGCNAPEKKERHSLHSPFFCIDETCLPVGAALIAAFGTQPLPK